MRTYMVGYDLNKPRANNDYKQLKDALQGFGWYWHYLDSTWIIKTPLNSVQIRDRLTPLIDSGDELLVARLLGEAAWEGFDTTAGTWLQSNLSAE